MEIGEDGGVEVVAGEGWIICEGFEESEGGLGGFGVAYGYGLGEGDDGGGLEGGEHLVSTRHARPVGGFE